MADRSILMDPMGSELTRQTLNPVTPGGATTPPIPTQKSIIGDVLGGVADAFVPGSGTVVRAIDKALSGSEQVIPGGESAVPGMTRFGDTGSCEPGFVKNQWGLCEFVGSPADISTGGQAAGTGVVVASGQPVMGRYGSAMRPTPIARTELKCPTGMILGTDNLCYDRLTNKERKWKKGARPLGTPGEMAAIRKAASFGKRLKKTEKSLAKLGRGLAPKKPARRSSGRDHHHHMSSSTPGVTIERIS